MARIVLARQISNAFNAVLHTISAWSFVTGYAHHFKVFAGLLMLVCVCSLAMGPL